MWPSLARQGADTCAIGGVLKESALMWAARQGYMTIIVDLLRVSYRCKDKVCRLRAARCTSDHFREKEAQLPPFMMGRYM